MDDIVWVGIRQSEIKYCNFINESINIFGNNENSLNKQIMRNINHNDVSNFLLIGKFYNNEVLNFIKKNKNVKFMYYSQIYTYAALKKLNVLDYVICLNNPDLIKFINNKFKVKEYLNDYIPILDYIYVNGCNFDYNKLKRIFKSNELVIQQDEGSGGSGTFILNKENIDNLKLEKDTTYMITKYLKNNISINNHILISDNDIYILPASIQNIKIVNNTLAYKGSDFIAYSKMIDKNIDKKIEKYTKIICEKLKEKGYRGVLGIDWLIYNNEVYFMEINPRFQNSSTLLNKGLMDNSLPSLQELHYNCFYNKKIILKPFRVNYSSYIVEDDVNIPIKPIEVLDEIKGVLYDKYSYKMTNVYDVSTIEY